MKKKDGVGWSRREFVGKTLAMAPALAVRPLTGESGQSTTPATALGPELVEPREIRSEGGVLRATLRARGGMHQVPDPASPTETTELRLRTYDDEIPGPTLRARVGERIQVRLENEIDASMFSPTSDTACNVRGSRNPRREWYPGKDRFPACFHGDNTTNLHYHGTHVSPEGSADNVLVEVRPGESYDNDFVLTRNDTLPPRFAAEQAPGTHWYHPHKHGSVALQVINGMAGAFIVEGDFDDALNAFYADAGEPLEEKLLVIQQYSDRINLDDEPAKATPPPFSVNGRYQPVIRMRPNEVQRWRLVNATMQQLANKRYRFLQKDVYDAGLSAATRRAADGAVLELDFPHAPGVVPELRQIARDGVQLAGDNYERLQREQEFLLAPGNRIDILVKAPPRPGQAVLDMVSASPLPPGAVIQPSEQYLVAVDVAGAPVDMAFPDANVLQRSFPSYLDDIRESEIRIHRRVEFKMEGGPGGSGGAASPPRFTIDGKEFDPNRVDQVMLMGSAEEWTIVNTSPPGAIHPFHIHINPFQVVEIYDPGLMGETPRVMQPPYVWQDTIALPPSIQVSTASGTTETRYGHVKIRHRFLDFPGKFVLHCHILGHEDRGMMQLVEVIDPTARG